MDLKLDINGDLDLTNGDLTLVTGTDRMKQQIEIRLRMFLGEWFLDARSGMPYFQGIFAKPFDASFTSLKIRQAVVGVASIVDVTNMDLDLNNTTRALSVSFAAIADTGAEIVFEGFKLP